MSNSIDPDEMVHYELSHLDLCCLQKPIIITCGSENCRPNLNLSVIFAVCCVEKTDTVPYVFFLLLLFSLNQNGVIMCPRAKQSKYVNMGLFFLVMYFVSLKIYLY